jgi:hypothetical protein
VFAIWGFEGRIVPPTFWGPQNFTGALIQITKPLNLAYFVWRVKICWWAFVIWDFEGGIGPWKCGELQNFAPRLQFEITKHLYLANLAQWATIIVQGFEFEALMVVLDPTAWGTSKNSIRAPISNNHIPKFSNFGSRNQMFLWVFWILGFEGWIGPPTHGGTHYSTEAPVSNHQTFKFRHFGSRVLPITKFKV